MHNSVFNYWLYQQIRNMDAGLNGYDPDGSLADIARRYTGEAAYMNWANNVARELGVPATTAWRDIA
jgi:hypothetical protein